MRQGTNQRNTSGVLCAGFLETALNGSWHVPLAPRPPLCPPSSILHMERRNRDWTSCCNMGRGHDFEQESHICQSSQTLEAQVPDTTLSSY